MWHRISSDQLLDVAESDLDYAMKFDKVPAAEYKKVQYIDRTVLDQLRRLSAEQIWDSHLVLLVPDLDERKSAVGALRADHTIPNRDANRVTLYCGRQDIDGVLYSCFPDPSREKDGSHRIASC